MISNTRLAWLISYIATASISAAIITPALPIIALQYHLSQGAVEWLVTAFLIGYVIGQLIYAPLANRLGRVTALRIGLTINLAGILVCIAAIYSQEYWLLVTGRLVSALGAAGGLACTLMLINEWLPETQRRAAMAYSILAFTLGIGIAVTLGGFITEYGQWAWCFGVLLVHGVSLLAGTIWLRETLTEVQPINFPSIIQGYRRVLASPMLLLFSVVVGFCSAIGYCFSAAGPQIAEQFLHLSAAGYGWWNLLNMAGMLGGGLWARRLMLNMAAKQVVYIGLAGCALGLCNLIVMVIHHSTSALWFFSSSTVLYLFGGLLFAGGSFQASSAIMDKGNGSAMLSFINMSTATLSVMVMGYLSRNPLLAFIEILSVLWIVITVCLLTHVSQQAVELQK
ncbi:MFS transporter [Legionella spiritensis]|uniref:MFS transporter n=1 Tax=Legionella spiritensis TaxID=452 RepID=UPI000F6B754F|nr:MFS transporter [Legionella spiritensis]VEG90364.1 major facilitator superfamily (MFS) transporter [Legionella spiritensis]